ncbi:glycosyltransferase [Nitrosarchaeum koreense]|jgi:UDP-N-acetylglucosamine--N-acetylmuramyl-(pentapeptide) pyrophosphoryl-undecaprenol N-acetylglucosamine transferase|uniref:Glycosyltransferase 28 domain-containing protein n=1 Tax=Nitrosarchaeum koreense MY1 TaxID=1001994 RepID=F9CYV9_9ARCH|nr:glycosyltransferase [Nitrosarchaeum koreense]EGP92927.1 Glycosyltransferase 28 domain-containing protein [Nitrosarchaeum koreense MY1]
MIDLDFFSSPIGLGHVTRDIAIANNFENISTKFITGSSATKILKNLDFKVEDVYIPPSFIIENGKLKNSTRWLWNYYQYYKKCKKISEEIIQKDKPKLIVSDEDFASLTVAQNKKIPTILITDIVQTNFVNGITSFIEKKMNKSMQKIMKNCDTVIIPENGPDEGNIKRVGPIVRQTSFSRDELRKKFSFDKKTIVISIGGTNAGLYLIEKTIELISKIKKDIDIIVVSGPSLSKKFGETVRNFGFVDNLHEIIFAADVIVSLAGKSTIDESKVYGTPGIFIPIKGHFEQEDNAKEEGFVFEDIYKIDELIIEKLEQKRNPVQTSGAINAYSIIKKLMQS